MRKIILVLIFILSLAAPSFAALFNQTDTFIITTYYPAPAGAYRQMKIYRSIKFMGVDKDAASLPGGYPKERGELVFNNTDGKFYVWNSTNPSASDGWKPVGGGSGETNIIVGTNPACPAGQTAVMRAYNGTWYVPSQVTVWSQVSCGQVTSADGTAFLVNSQHTTKNCNDAGGTVIGDGSGNNMCRFNTACPAGWQRYEGWSATSSAGCTTATYLQCGGCFGPCAGCGASGGHAWSNLAPESVLLPAYLQPYPCACSCSATGACASGSCTAHATIVQDGCY